MTRELRLLIIVGALFALAMLAGMVSWHEKHYAKRRLELLEADVQVLRRIVTEDRTV